MNFKRLRIWQEAHYLTLEIYRLTQSFPPHEVEGLSLEMRNSVLRIASQIARASGVLDAGDRVRSLRAALRSAKELKVRIEIAKGFNFIDVSPAQELSNQADRIELMLKKSLLKVRTAAQHKK